MVELKKEELLLVNGGAKFSAALLSSIVKGFGMVLELGRSVGTAIRRLTTGKLC